MFGHHNQIISYFSHDLDTSLSLIKIQFELIKVVDEEMFNPTPTDPFKVPLPAHDCPIYDRQLLQNVGVQEYGLDKSIETIPKFPFSCRFV
jgi:uncharacterized protein YlaN (UPF0358 family)